jgi:hypothetical protein
MLILAFPNGGSTALAQMLLTAVGTVALNPRAEGQWLVPAMSAPRVRWDPESSLDYADIRTRWINAVRQAERPVSFKEPVLVIEKSPPNMCRYSKIVSMLAGMKTYTVVMTRDPYATCASWHVRYGPEQVERDWGWPGPRPADEDAYFRALGDIWIKRAKYLDAARANAVHWIRYEDFSERPSVVVGDLARKIPCLRTVNSTADIAVKDYPRQKVRNMNNNQISILTQRQRTAISSALNQNSELVARFGYDAMPPQAG